MMSNKTFGTIIAAVFTLAAAIPASAAPNSSDACSLLSQSQISAAVGKQVGAGTWMTPSFKATCNWTAPGVIVTLMTEGVDKYQAGKTPISPMMQIVAAGGIGDDAYYVVTGTIAMLYTKGSVAFKTASTASCRSTRSRNCALATQVASEL